MTKKQQIQLFEEKKVRTAWDDQEEKWYFSIVDVCGVLTDSENPQTYWRVLKNRLKKEGNETVTNCNALKMRSPDGVMISSGFALGSKRRFQNAAGERTQDSIAGEREKTINH